MPTKNPFATQPEPPVYASAAVAAQVKLKQKQMRSGQTRAEVEQAMAKVEAAHKELLLSQSVAADEDSTTALQRMTRAEDDARDKEKKLTIAIRKDEAAQADLKQAEEQVAIEAEAAACERVLALGPRGEEVFAVVRQLAVDLARETEVLRSTGGNEKYAYIVSQILAQFEFFLRVASHPRTTDCPSAFKKYESFTACVVALCGQPRP